MKIVILNSQTMTGLLNLQIQKMFKTMQLTLCGQIDGGLKASWINVTTDVVWVSAVIYGVGRVEELKLHIRCVEVGTETLDGGL